jgi:hypothetical protein
MRAAPLTRFQWRIGAWTRFAPLLLVRLVKNQWRIGVRSLVFFNGAPMAHRAPNAQAGPAPDGTSPTDQRNQDHGARAELVLLAINGPFTLYEREGCSTAEWRSLKLVRDPREEGKKNNWWLGWNGARLARNTDTKKLAEHHPEVLQWVIDGLRAKIEVR